MQRSSRSISRGFTAIESLVVMAVIVLLASIVIPGLMGRKAKEVPLPNRMPAASQDATEGESATGDEAGEE